MARTARMLLAAAVACACLASFTGTATAGVPESGFTETVVAAGLLQPTAIAPLPDGRVLVTEKAGRVLVAKSGAAKIAHTIGTCTDGDMGLLGAAVSPSGAVYVYVTTSSCNPTGRVNQVLRGTLSGELVSFAGNPLLTGIPTGSGFRNGGGLRIGPDARLYIGTGDAGTGSDAQSASLAGKVLRLDPNAASPSAEVYALGFRDPQRFGFDPLTGRLWLGDVGEALQEEIDVVNYGANYGWPDCEGAQPSCPPSSVRPVFTYPHAGADSLGRTVIGGAFAPANFGPYGGQYFFGDSFSGNIYRVPLNGARDGFAARPVLFVAGAEGPRDIQFGADGGLYYAASAGGSVRRVGPATGVGTLTDRTPPRHKIRIRKRQRLSRLNFADTLNEPATLTVTGTVVSSGASKSKTFRLRRVVRQAQANRRVRVRLKLRKKSAAVRAARLVRRGKRTRVRIKVTARDGAGNVSTERRTVRVTRP